MTLREIPVGTKVTINHQFLVSEIGYWCWETEEVTGIVYKHPNESITLLQTVTQLISCRNDKDEIIN